MSAAINMPDPQELPGNEPREPDYGQADWVFVHPGHDADHHWGDIIRRPYGEVNATAVRVPTAWANGGNTSLNYDIAVVTLDRNIGDLADHFGRKILDLFE